MSQAEIVQDPPFRSVIRASGLGEVWTHTHDQLKFDQFGWRCTNKENSYSNDTLVGNWSEEKFDIKERKKAEPLPSQYGHYYDSTYDKSYNKNPRQVPDELKHLKARHPHAHPAHQPDLDHPSLKAVYNSWETTSRAAYVEPRAREAPLK